MANQGTDEKTATSIHHTDHQLCPQTLTDLHTDVHVISHGFAQCHTDLHEDDVHGACQPAQPTAAPIPLLGAEVLPPGPALRHIIELVISDTQQHIYHPRAHLLCSDVHTAQAGERGLRSYRKAML